MADNKVITQIETVSATGEEIHEVIVAMQPALEGRKQEHVFIACLEIALAISNPALSSDQLREAVRDCSHWIALYVSDIGVPIPKEKIN